MVSRVAEALLRAGCLMRGEFRLSSGGVSTVYVDVRRLYSYPVELRVVAEELARLMGLLEFDLVAGVESGGIPLATLAAWLLGKPMVYVRKKPKSHGTMAWIEGVARRGATALVVDDVATTGSSIARAAGLLREVGVAVLGAVVVVDREEGASERLAGEGIKLYSLTTLSEIRGLADHVEG